MARVVLRQVLGEPTEVAEHVVFSQEPQDLGGALATGAGRGEEEDGWGKGNGRRGEQEKDKRTTSNEGETNRWEEQHLRRSPSSSFTTVASNLLNFDPFPPGLVGSSSASRTDAEPGAKTCGRLGGRGRRALSREVTAHGEKVSERRCDSGKLLLVQSSPTNCSVDPGSIRVW
ncbi:hypothetical protein FA13DRAFT_1717837 [Coprinellus micaceus]|uniref:Uncharacterized protein n=1 Tax=Coprinellus micaceus TaxID=71717 RepID=A0A4Y7SEW9_COPMI|nr:hypothetical protein FA13DRAFT_1717837 [Coprinellus micaceus]